MMKKRQSDSRIFILESSTTLALDLTQVYSKHMLEIKSAYCFELRGIKLHLAILIDQISPSIPKLFHTAIDMHPLKQKECCILPLSVKRMHYYI